MSDQADNQPMSDGQIQRRLYEELAKWRQTPAAKEQPKPLSHEEHWRKVMEPEAQHSWLNYTKRAFGLMNEAGLVPDRCKGNDWKVLTEVLSRALAWDMPHGFLLCGNSGNGKTTILRLIKAWGYAGRNEFGWRFRESVALKQEIVDAAGATIAEPSWDVRCLLIDDMGTETAANVFGVKVEALHQVIDDRWKWNERGGRTIISSNKDPEELAARYGERAWSRINGMCRIVKLVTPDQRRITQ